MCFYYLLAGHLLGDFILQTDRIAENKAVQWTWNALHAAVVTLCVFLFSIPFGPVIMLLSLAGGLLHFAIDYFKPYLAKKLKLPDVVLFYGDQGLHIAILYFISAFAKNPPSVLLSWLPYIKILIVIETVTAFCGVSNQFLLKLFFPSRYKNPGASVSIRFRVAFSRQNNQDNPERSSGAAKYSGAKKSSGTEKYSEALNPGGYKQDPALQGIPGKSLFEENEKPIGNISRLLITFGLYLSCIFTPRFVVLALAAVVVNISQYYLQWNMWMERSYFWTKLLLDMSSSFAVIAFMLFA